MYVYFYMRMYACVFESVPYNVLSFVHSLPLYYVCVPSNCILIQLICHQFNLKHI